MRLLIQYGADPNARDKDGKAPLHYAIEKGNRDAVLLLMEYNADLNVQDEGDRTPLYWTISYNNTDIAKLLIFSGAEINNSTSLPLLHRAIEKNNQEIVQLLVQSKADLNAKNKYGNTPLDIAVHYERLNIIMLLIDSGAKIDSNMLFYAVEKGNKNIITSLISHGANVNVQNNAKETPLHTAIYQSQGNEYIVTLLLLNGADVNVPDNAGKTPIDIAIGHSNERIVQLLIQNGTKISNKSDLLYQVTDKGYKNVVETLISSHVDLNFKYEYNAGDTLLHLVAKKGYKDIARLFIANGADLNAKNEYGNTPLDIAVHYGHLNIIMLLIDSGAEINSNVLFYAFNQGNQDMIESLILHNANINIQNNAGETPLHIAVNQGDKHIIQSLVSHGASVGNRIDLLHQVIDRGHENIAELLIKAANPNIKYSNDMGNTLLHLAAEKNYQGITRLLIEKGVNVNAKNKYGQSPLDLAILSGRAKTVQLLIDEKAEINLSDKIVCCQTIGHDLKNVVEYCINKAGNINMLYDSHGSLLHYAAKKGYTDTAELLIKSRADVNVLDEKLKTPLHYAAEEGYVNIAKLLISSCVDVDIRNIDSKTPLFLAIGDGNQDMVVLLIENGASINIYDISFNTPLHYAADKNDNYPIFELLVMSGADIYASNQHNQTAMSIAVSKNNTNVIDLLTNSTKKIENTIPSMKKIDHDSCGDMSIIINQVGKHPECFYPELPFQSFRDLPFCSDIATTQDVLSISNTNYIRGNTSMVGSGLLAYFFASKFMCYLNQKKMISDKKNELFDSICIGDIKKTTLLLKSRVNPNVKSDSNQAPIHVAVLSSNLRIVKKLVRFGADINILNCNGSTALDLAIYQQDQDMIGFLLDQGAMVDIGSTPTLYLAILRGKQEIVRLLYDRGANINLNNDEGCTALFPAVSGDYIEIASFLLESKANVNVSDIYGTYPIHLAVSHAKNLDMVTLLCDFGADVNVQDNMGRTALSIAITCYAQEEKNGMQDIVGFLLRKKARSDISDKNGDYPIHLAIKQMEHPIIVEMLLVTDQNNVNHRDLAGLTPLNLAIKYGNLDAVIVLVKYNSISDIGHAFAIATENEIAYPAIERFLLQCIRDFSIKNGIEPISVGSVILWETEFSKLPKHKVCELFTPKRKRSNDSSSTKSSSFYSMSTQSSSASFKSCSSISTALCDKFNDLLDFDQFECDSVSPAVKRVKISR